jgi:hypothetical protein
MEVAAFSWPGMTPPDRGDLAQRVVGWVVARDLRWLEKNGSANTTTNATRLSSAPASAVLRTPGPASSTPPNNAPAVIPALKAVEVPALAMSDAPGA